jgi:LacI family transcriptional regulator
VVASPIWEESATRILKGIARYQREHSPWEVHWDYQGASVFDTGWFTRQPWRGVISRHTNSLQVESCRKLGIPIVDVNNAEPIPGVPNVVLQNHAVGRLGGEHFIERGFRNFAFCGFHNERWSCERRSGFVEAVRGFGRECALLEREYPGTYAGGCTPKWETEEIESIARWLAALPKPVGVMSCNDYRATQVLFAAQHMGSRVPEDVAVLGANDDEARCELANPPLSSVATNHLRSGYVAAEALDCLMNQRPLGRGILAVSPVEVVTRQSTDILAVDDPKIAKAVHFIQQNACRGTRVDAVCRHAGIARTQLEEKFRKYFARTPQSEIRRIQLARVRQLLQDTDLPLDSVAELCGFRHPEYLIVFFKREMGVSPGRFRRGLRS